MKTFLAAATVLVGLSMPAFANECPSLIQKAEEAMKTAQVDDAMKNKIMEHITLAKSQHDVGKHDESVATLNDALKLLGV